MDVALLIFLILLNALFAMSEMALTASRKARLQVTRFIFVLQLHFLANEF